MKIHNLKDRGNSDVNATTGDILHAGAASIAAQAGARGSSVSRMASSFEARQQPRQSRNRRGSYRPVQSPRNPGDNPSGQRNEADGHEQAPDYDHQRNQVNQQGNPQNNQPVPPRRPPVPQPTGGATSQGDQLQDPCPPPQEPEATGQDHEDVNRQQDLNQNRPQNSTNRPGPLTRLKS